MHAQESFFYVGKRGNEKKTLQRWVRLLDKGSFSENISFPFSEKERERRARGLHKSEH
jgi:hypothetical protein